MYKLHVELAERVASSREDINKLHSGMVTGVVAASVLLHRLAPSAEMIWVLPVLGAIVSVSWIMSSLSMTAKLTAKHCVLLTLEKELPFDFLDRENREFSNGFWRRKYMAIVMPVLFFLLCAALFYMAITAPESTPPPTDAIIDN